MVEHDDAVRAGAIAGRVGFERLRVAARAKKFDILLVEEMSRFSRDFLGGFALLAELKKDGVRFADTKTGLLDLESQVGQFTAFMGLSFGSQETKRLGERSKRGLKGKVLQKFSAGGRPAYGYAREPVFSATQVDVDGRPKREGVRFVPHPMQSLIVKRIFERYRDGDGKHAIATLLNNEGVPSAGAGGSRSGRANSGTWSTASVKGILENELYSGVRIWNRTSRLGEKHPNSGKKEQRANPETDWVNVEGFVPPLVVAETWSLVQQRLKADGEKYKRSHNANGSRQYLLSGMIRCAGCGASFSIGVHRGMPPVPHYRCTFHSRGSSVCTNPVVVSQVALEAKLKGVLEVLVKDPGQLKVLVAEHNRRISSTNEQQLAVVRTLEARQATLTEGVERLVAAVASGKGAPKALVDAIDKKETELQELARKIAEASTLVQPLLLPKQTAVADYVAGRASLFTGDFAHDRKFLEHAVDRVLVYESGALVVQFKQESLFEPVRFATLGEPSKADIAARRLEYEAEFREQKAEVVRRVGAQAARNLAVDFLQDGEGRPAYVMFTPGSVRRTFGPGRYATALGGSNEIALASPAGVEPALAT